MPGVYVHVRIAKAEEEPWLLTPSKKNFQQGEGEQSSTDTTMFYYASLPMGEPDHGTVAAPDGAPKRIASIREVVQGNLAVGIRLPLQQSFLK